MIRQEWKPLIPKSGVGLYGSESEKIYPVIKKYLNGTIYDIGCGNNKIIPTAIGIDGRKFDNVDIVCDVSEIIVDDNSADIVFSSHCLEHILDDYEAIIEWARVLKPGGFLILYLPDGDYYNNYENTQHIRDYNYYTFMQFFERAFCGQGYFWEQPHPKYFNVIESGLDIGPDKYSFYLVAQKL